MVAGRGKGAQSKTTWKRSSEQGQCMCFIVDEAKNPNFHLPTSSIAMIATVSYHPQRMFDPSVLIRWAGRGADDRLR